MAYTPNPDREVKKGKAVVSAQELADFREKFGKDQTLRDLLNMDKGMQRKIEIPKSMRNLPENKPDMFAEGDAYNITQKFKIPTKEESNMDREKNMSRGMRSAEYKKGGKIKKMAAGGSASKRADGICVKGKTKGKFV